MNDQLDNKSSNKDPKNGLTDHTLSPQSYILFYILLAAGAVYFTKSIETFFDFSRLGKDIVWGILIGGLVVGLSYELTTKTKIFNDVTSFLKQVIQPMSKVNIFLLALFSSIGEELFFRGLLQSHLGILGTSILFGLIHVGPSIGFLPWTAFAFIMGLLLGYLQWSSGSLVSSIIVHFIVNLCNMIILRKQPFDTSVEES